MDKVIAREEKALESVKNAGALSQVELIRRQKTILFLRELAVKIVDARLAKECRSVAIATGRYYSSLYTYF